MALRITWLISTWTVLGTLPSLPFFTLFLYFYYIINIYIIYFIIFYSLLFFLFYLEWIQNVFLTSTDVQTRRARCQHQLSLLFFFGPGTYTTTCFIFACNSTIDYNIRCCYHLTFISSSLCVWYLSVFLLLFIRAFSLHCAFYNETGASGQDGWQRSSKYWVIRWSLSPSRPLALVPKLDAVQRKTRQHWTKLVVLEVSCLAKFSSERQLIWRTCIAVNEVSCGPSWPIRTKFHSSNSEDAYIEIADLILALTLTNNSATQRNKNDAHYRIIFFSLAIECENECECECENDQLLHGLDQLVPRLGASLTLNFSKLPDIFWWLYISVALNGLQAVVERFPGLLLA